MSDADGETVLTGKTDRNIPDNLRTGDNKKTGPPVPVI
jgi:hypothetical protein